MRSSFSARAPVNGTLLSAMDLYLAVRSDNRDIVNLGRSDDPQRCYAHLCNCHCFDITVVHVFPGCGRWKKTVQKALEPYRAKSSSSREWFEIDLSTARAIVEHHALRK